MATGRGRTSPGPRILIVEDRAPDAELIQRELKRSGLAGATQVVDTEADFRAALLQFVPDLVLTDHSLPSFGAREALRIAREVCPDTPVLVVTGSLDEETAVEYMRAGAADYVLKDRIVRLGPASLRALELSRARRAEAELHEQLRALIQASPLAILGLDSEGRVRTWNAAAEHVFGWTSTEVVGQPLPIVPDPQRAEQQELLRRVLGGEVLTSVEATRRRKDGRLVEVSISAGPVKDSAGSVTGAIALIADITVLKRLEAQLLQAQKMEAIGRLAGGIAHDFNNLLTAILGSAEMLDETLGTGHPGHEDADEIRRAAQRAAELTRQLLAFSRRQPLQATVLDLNEVVHSTEKLLRRLIGEDVELRAVLGDDLGAVRADRGQLEQVITNLAVNSRDAMPRGGRLTIETRNVDLDPSFAQERPDLIPGSYVMLAVSDTGTGMEPETLTHVFEPFFTTKEPGKGTGLGLATVYGIVQQSGGHIYVYSEPMHGTSFKIYLPRVAETVAPPALPVPQTAAHRGTETILLVEDDPAVRVLTRRMLESRGYTVLAAANGTEGVEAARRYAGEIHLLVTDVVMPEMNGRELFTQLSAQRSGLRVLFLSGYTDEAIVRHGNLERGVPFLQKPFTPETLARKVREALVQR
jgi:PAS domain S-box-containing protein